MNNKSMRRELSEEQAFQFHKKIHDGFSNILEEMKSLPKEVDKVINDLDVGVIDQTLIANNIVLCKKGNGDVDRLLIDVCDHPALFQCESIRDLIRNKAQKELDKKNKDMDRENKQRREHEFWKEAYRAKLEVDTYLNPMNEKGRRRIKDADVIEALCKDIQRQGSESSFKTKYSNWLKSNEGHAAECFLINAISRDIKCLMMEEGLSEEDAMKCFIEEQILSDIRKLPTLFRLITAE